MELKQGSVVKVYEDGEALDEGVILSVGEYGDKKIHKIEFKSSILKIDDIVEFVNFFEREDDDEDKTWHVLFKNPMHPNRKTYSDDTPAYVFKLI